MLLTASSNLLLSPRTPKVPGFALPTSGPATEAAAGRAKAAPAPPLPRCSPKPTPRRARKTTSRSARPATISRRAPAPRSGRLCGTSSDVRSPRSRASSIPNSLKAIGGDWTYESPQRLVANPKSEASGTKMAFAGEKDAKKRADILDYLQTLCRLAGPVSEVRRSRLEVGNSTSARVACKEIQGSPRKMLGFPWIIWSNWDFSTGYIEKNKKIGGG